MPFCSNCGATLTPEMKFCGECGAPLPQMNHGGDGVPGFDLKKDITGVDHSTSNYQIQQTIYQGVAAPSGAHPSLGASSLVECLSCGSVVRMSKTFRCRQCNRKPLCREHCWDAERRICRDCAESQSGRKKSDDPAEKDRPASVTVNPMIALRHKEYRKTMSNPFYDSDLSLMESHDYDINLLVDSRCILIVTGCAIQCELLDRPVAEILRDAIDGTRGDNTSRRAVVLGDMFYSNHLKESTNPVISVGGPLVNTVTDWILSGKQPQGKHGIHQYIDREQNRIRIALWGDNATQTRISVEKFINDAAGLQKLLSEMPG